jgi:dephospho-CoA kinase
MSYRNNRLPHIAISGYAASGKSEISKLLVTELAYTKIAFGERMREVAIARGLPLSRTVLIQLGRDIVKNEGWHDFVKLFLKDVPPDSHLLLDGVRDLPAWIEIKQQLSCRGIALIHLDASRIVRRERLIERRRADDMAVDIDEFQSNEQAETDLDKLKLSADLVVNAEASPQKVLDEIRRFIFL